ncbi:MAG: hypothetical protein CVU62_08100 [Deltaproteobacteria bacterium HGW-Deltaproteobacteria-2]|jgi:hypothetical protein|nr:MAG: hypothetical protein CVU62_08100 [Deltaproteobacteria bacterium HGW-Deltaproteobacteria-2]
MFKPNRKFKRNYDRLYRKDPAAANVFLMLAELADENGEVKLVTPFPEEEIQRLMVTRFDDPRRYSL